MRLFTHAIVKIFGLFILLISVTACQTTNSAAPEKVQTKTEAPQKTEEMVQSLLEAGEAISFALSREAVALSIAYGQKTPASPKLLQVIQAARKTVNEQQQVFGANLTALSEKSGTSKAYRDYFEALESYISKQAEIDLDLKQTNYRSMRARNAYRPIAKLQTEIENILSRNIYSTHSSNTFPQLQARLRLVQLDFYGNKKWVLFSEYVAARQMIPMFSKSADSMYNGQQNAIWTDFTNLTSSIESLNIYKGEFKIVDGEVVIVSVAPNNQLFEKFEQVFFNEMDNTIFEIYDTSDIAEDNGVDEPVVDYRLGETELLEIVQKQQALINALRLRLL